LRAFEAAETAQQTLNTGKNTEVKQFECKMTGMRLCDLPSSPSALGFICSLLPFYALRLRWAFLRQSVTAAFVSAVPQGVKGYLLLVLSNCSTAGECSRFSERVRLTVSEVTDQTLR
jgi:hypothetical protein